MKFFLVTRIRVLVGLSFVGSPGHSAPHSMQFNAKLSDPERHTGAALGDRKDCSKSSEALSLFWKLPHQHLLFGFQYIHLKKVKMKRNVTAPGSWTTGTQNMQNFGPTEKGHASEECVLYYPLTNVTLKIVTIYSRSVHSNFDIFTERSML